MVSKAGDEPINAPSIDASAALPKDGDASAQHCDEEKGVSHNHPFVGEGSPPTSRPPQRPGKEDLALITLSGITKLEFIQACTYKAIEDLAYKPTLAWLKSPDGKKSKYDEQHAETFLERFDSRFGIWSLSLIFKESPYVTDDQLAQFGLGRTFGGEALTRSLMAEYAAIADGTVPPALPKVISPKHKGRVDRVVEACELFGLVEYAEPPNKKARPFYGSQRLAEIMTQIGVDIHIICQEELQGLVTSVTTPVVSDDQS